MNSQPSFSMTRVRSEDVLKPGAKMVVHKIDFNDPEIKARFEQTKREQKRLKRMMQWTQDDYDAMRRVITI